MSNLPESSPPSKSNELMRLPTGGELVRQVESGLGLVRDVLREGDAEYWFELGKSAYEQKNHSEAVAHLDQAIKTKCNVASFYRYRSFSKHELGDTVGALKDADYANELGPTTFAHYVFQAIRKRCLKLELVSALSDCERAIFLNSKSYSAYYCMAEVKVLLGDYLGSLADYNSAISLNSSLPKLHSDRAKTKIILGDQLGAEADFAKAAELERQAKQESS